MGCSAYPFGKQPLLSNAHPPHQHHSPTPPTPTTLKHNTDAHSERLHLWRLYGRPGSLARWWWRRRRNQHSYSYVRHPFPRGGHAEKLADGQGRPDLGPQPGGRTFGSARARGSSRQGTFVGWDGAMEGCFSRRCSLACVPSGGGKEGSWKETAQGEVVEEEGKSEYRQWWRVFV